MQHEPIPEFSAPPVVEVAIGIEFVPILGLDVIRLTDIVRDWSPDYPDSQQAPALVPAIPPGTAFLPLQISASNLRLWAIQSDQRRLIQVQHDRLILNWRRLNDPAGTYPSYKILIGEFSKRWSEFVVKLKGMGFERPRPLVGEVTYVNVISLADFDNDPGNVISLFAQPNPLGDPAFSTVSEGFDVTIGEEVCGQMTVQYVHGVDPIAGRVDALTVSSRVTFPSSPAADEGVPVVPELDRAHVVSVGGFARVTTHRAHEMWGRVQ